MFWIDGFESTIYVKKHICAVLQKPTLTVRSEHFTKFYLVFISQICLWSTTHFFSKTNIA